PSLRYSDLVDQRLARLGDPELSRRWRRVYAQDSQAKNSELGACADERRYESRIRLLGFPARAVDVEVIADRAVQVVRRTREELDVDAVRLQQLLLAARDRVAHLRWPRAIEGVEVHVAERQVPVLIAVPA